MKHYLLFIVSSLLVAACAPVYVQNVRTAPMFDKAGEFQGAVLFKPIDGFAVQGAVAVTNHLALMGDYSYSKDDAPASYRHKHTFYEGGMGYYRNVRKFCYEVFLGHGEGEGMHNNLNSNPHVGPADSVLQSGKYKRYFIQPSFGFKKSFITAAAIARLSVVDFTQLLKYRDDGSLIEKTDPSPKVFLEPAVVGRFNFCNNRFFGTVQVGLCIIFGDKLFAETDFNYTPLTVTTGIGFRLGGVRWHSKQKHE